MLWVKRYRLWCAEISNTISLNKGTHTKISGVIRAYYIRTPTALQTQPANHVCKPDDRRTRIFENIRVRYAHVFQGMVTTDQTYFKKISTYFRTYCIKKFVALTCDLCANFLFLSKWQHMLMNIVHYCLSQNFHIWFGWNRMRMGISGFTCARALHMCINIFDSVRVSLSWDYLIWLSGTCSLDLNRDMSLCSNYYSCFEMNMF